jgi:hypothetical protein
MMAMPPMMGMPAPFNPYGMMGYPPKPYGMMPGMPMAPGYGYGAPGVGYGPLQPVMPPVCLLGACLYALVG